MTETKPFTQSKKTYFSIVLYTAYRKRWWMYLLVILVSIFNLYKYLNNNQVSYLIWGLVGVGYILFLYIYLYRFAYSKDKEEFLSEKKLSFDENNIRIEEANGGFGEFPYSRIWKVVDKESFWMLYTSNSQFIYIPKDIFYSEEDFERFQQAIQLK